MTKPTRTDQENALFDWLESVAPDGVRVASANRAQTIGADQFITLQVLFETKQGTSAFKVTDVQENPGSPLFTANQRSTYKGRADINVYGVDHRLIIRDIIDSRDRSTVYEALKANGINLISFTPAADVTQPKGKTSFEHRSHTEVTFSFALVREYDSHVIETTNTTNNVLT